jgi:hypothetical protein
MQPLFKQVGLTLCHVTRSLLVFRQDEFEVFRVVDGVKDGKDGTSGVAD